MNKSEIDNITVRKTARSNSMDSLLNAKFNSDSTVLDTTMMGLPDNSLNDTDTIYKYRDTIKRLTSELESAHLEIENLNSENFRLKMDIGQYQKVIDTYKKLETRSFTPRSTRKSRIRMDCFSTPTKLCISPMAAIQHDTAVANGSDVSFGTAGSNCSVGQIQHIDTPLQAGHCNSGECNINPSTHDAPSKTESASVVETEGHLAETTGVQLTVTKPTTYADNPRNQSQSISGTGNTQRVMIFGDQAGYGIRNIIQDYLGKQFTVTSFIKPYATTKEVLKPSESLCKDFGKSDFVIILAGANDRNPMDIQTYLHYTLRQLQFTNVLVVPLRKQFYLNENNVNNLLKLVCHNCKTSCFVPFQNDSIVSKKSVSKLHICRLIHRQILHLNYKVKYQNYVEKLHTTKRQVSTKDAGIQTCDLNDVSVQNVRDDKILQNNFDFFRK
ncbi:unnamed protein product [Spodoptera littoralis]|uniref:Uncharacterized protein n=1 Tax=Spodoptera littoralis TaxID=7109 RepID=A0A9P0HYP5_SPOLI|nr:unnamed protein product [Spodoptera littoralis]CAH1636951.1 unnamed protein product [Spodoptera littoralis]